MADPAAPGGRDLFYLFNTYADKLRFVIGIAFRTFPDYLEMGIRLVDKYGLPPGDGFTRVLFALQTSQIDMRFIQDAQYDPITGLIIVYANRTQGGWYIVRTHQMGVNQTDPLPEYPLSMAQYQASRKIKRNEMNMGVAFAVETADSLGDWDSDPMRRSAFFGIQWGPYASGFKSFSPYAMVNLTVTGPFSFLAAAVNKWLMSLSPPWIVEVDNSIPIQDWLASRRNTTMSSNSTVVVVDSPFVSGGVDDLPQVFYQAPIRTGNQSSDFYYQASITTVVAGINVSSIPNISSLEQPWLVYPIALLLGMDVENVPISVGRLELLDVSPFANRLVNISSQFSVPEWDIIMQSARETTPIRPGSRRLSADSLFMSTTTILVNASSPEDAALTILFIEVYVFLSFPFSLSGHPMILTFIFNQERLEWVSAAATFGTIKLEEVYPELANTRLLNGVSRIGLGIVTSAVLRRFLVSENATVPVVNMTTPPPPDDIDSGGSSILSPKFARASLSSGLAITTIVLFATFVYWEYLS